MAPGFLALVGAPFARTRTLDPGPWTLDPGPRSGYDTPCFSTSVIAPTNVSISPSVV